MPVSTMSPTTITASTPGRGTIECVAEREVVPQDAIFSSARLL
jgi:hypothetical protein